MISSRLLRASTGSSAISLHRLLTTSTLSSTKTSSTLPLPSSIPPPATTQQLPPLSTPSTPTTSATQSTPTSVPRPTRSRLRPRKAPITLTPHAIAQLKRLLSQPDPKLIRVGVKNRGCSGLAYNLEYVEKAGSFDETVEQEGVKVLIDSKALFSIIGSEMDFVEDKLNRRFVFRNPNISEWSLPLPSSHDFQRLLTVCCRGAMWVWRVIHGVSCEQCARIPMDDQMSLQ